MYTIIDQTVFGEFNRYKVTLAIDRFGKWCCLVEDAELTDELTQLPSVIAQVTQA